MYSGAGYCLRGKKTRSRLTATIAAWIFDGHGQSKWVNREVKEEPKAQWENWYFLALSKLFSAAPRTWNKSARTLEKKTPLEFIVLHVMDGGLRWTVENRWANHSTIMPVAGTGWLDLESLWFGFEEQWLNDMSTSSLHTTFLFLQSWGKDCTCSFLLIYWVGSICLLKAISWEKKKEKRKSKIVISTFYHLRYHVSSSQWSLEKLLKAPPIASSIACTPQCTYRVEVHIELNPPAGRYMWGVGLHAACIRVPMGGAECLRQASSSSDPLPTGMGEAASSWDFTLLLSVWLQPLPTGCFPVCAPHCYDRWRTNMRDPQLVEG